MIDLSELESRLARLEAAAAKQRRKGATNHKGAAEYLGCSEETLRRRHQQGDGPPRARNGPRGWIYLYADLDRYVEERQ